MKKSGYILLVALAAIFMAYGMNRQRSEADAATRSDADTPAAATVTKAPHYQGLDWVRIESDAPSQEKEYSGFRLSFNKNNKTPNWVSWELLGSETEGAAKRSNRFWTDDDIYGCPSTSDYSRSGFDRGHLCPAADQKWSDDAMADCFVMANMCPQDHALNAGAWNTLENKERAWARRDSAIVIVAGPVYSPTDTQAIGEAGVRVPGAFFKAIVAPYVDSPRGIAFVFPNMSAPGNMENYVTTIDEVEKLTGLDLFYKLPDDIEKAVESTASFREWNRRN